MRQRGNQAEPKQTAKFRRHVDSDVLEPLAAFPALEVAATAVELLKALAAAEVPFRAGVAANCLPQVLATFPFARYTRRTVLDPFEFGPEDQGARRREVGQ